MISLEVGLNSPGTHELEQQLHSIANSSVSLYRQEMELSRCGEVKKLVGS